MEVEETNYSSEEIIADRGIVVEDRDVPSACRP